MFCKMIETKNESIAPLAVNNIKGIVNARNLEQKEKAEALRQINLKRIRNMTGGTGIDPFERFPKEVWEKVFAKLDPPDLGNVYEAHSRFRDILECDRIREILLPQLFEVNRLRYYIRNPENMPEASPFGVEKFFGDDLSRLRGISKSMRNAVDNWVDRSILKRIRETEDEDDLAYPWFDLDSHQSLEKILASYGGSNDNGILRFFPRGILVFIPSWGGNVDDMENEDHLEALDSFLSLKNQITALLEIIGDQIWQFQLAIGSDDRLEIEWDREEINLSEAYLAFQHWAHLMPNMKWLRLDIGPLPEKPASISATVIAENSFPHLPSLERVRFQFHRQGLWQKDEGMKTDILGIHEAVLEANMQIRTLNLMQADGSIVEYLPTDAINSAQLTNFCVYLAKDERDEDDIDLQLSFHQIQPMINYKWPLTIIELFLYEEGVPVYSMLRFLERFSTLEKVALRLEKPTRMGFYGDSFGYLNLPKLTYFDVKITKPEIDFGNGSNVEWFFSIQFLLQCKMLETLVWELHGFDDCELRDYLKEFEVNGNGSGHGSMIEFRAGLKILYDSNIWGVFPSLGLVKVRNWKLESDDSGECKERCCEHGYFRESANEGVTVTRFLETHSCCRFDSLESCVLLKQ